MNDKRVVTKYIRDALSGVYWVTSSIDEKCEFITDEEAKRIIELQRLLESIYTKLNK